MDNSSRARVLTDELHLDRTPVALAFVDEPPPGVTVSTAVEPSACTFWRLAEQSLFYAAADRHLECGVGTMTMGFEMPAERQPAAMELVGMMVEMGYLDSAETAHLPMVGAAHQGILYGPLASFPVEPDVALAIVTPTQGMVLAEASDAVTLRERPGLPTLGRPACAAVAWSANEGDVTLSLGCIGARTYVEVPDDRAIVVIPGAALDGVAAKIGGLAKANRDLAAFHQGRKSAYAAAQPAR
ncbi:MAG: DUF169 domain-containing protein [Chloroflexi bacterium]|nr:DUF169 domain-containing protein [Chloroflexota bacterium]